MQTLWFADKYYLSSSSLLEDCSGCGSNPAIRWWSCTTALNGWNRLCPFSGTHSTWAISLRQLKKVLGYILSIGSLARYIISFTLKTTTGVCILQHSPYVWVGLYISKSVVLLKPSKGLGGKGADDVGTDTAPEARHEHAGWRQPGRQPRAR